jgi:hypothetical protein
MDNPYENIAVSVDYKGVMTVLRDVVVRRSHWVRGGGVLTSALASPLIDHVKEVITTVKHCCIGFAAMTFGCDFRNAIEDFDPVEYNRLVHYAHNLQPSELAKFPAAWLKAEEEYSSVVGGPNVRRQRHMGTYPRGLGSIISAIYLVNDGAFSDKEREEYLGHLAPLVGINFIFVD